MYFCKARWTWIHMNCIRQIFGQGSKEKAVCSFVLLSPVFNVSFWRGGSAKGGDDIVRCDTLASCSRATLSSALELSWCWWRSCMWLMHANGLPQPGGAFSVRGWLKAEELSRGDLSNLLSCHAPFTETYRNIFGLFRIQVSWSKQHGTRQHSQNSWTQHCSRGHSYDVRNT